MNYLVALHPMPRHPAMADPGHAAENPLLKGWFGERLVRGVAHYLLDRWVYPACMT